MTDSAAQTLPGFIHSRAVLGAHVQVMPGASIAADARVGDSCVLESGAHVGAKAQVGPQVVIGPNAVIAGPDIETSPGAVIESGVRVGANATVLAGVSVGADAVIRPGAVVMRSVPARAVVEGNPAIIVGYVDVQHSGSFQSGLAAAGAKAVEQTNVRNVTLHRMPVVPDLRGNLTVGEFERDIPFAPLRYFMVFGVPNREVRGEHAHKECHQFLICVRGSCSVVADDGERRVEVVLDSPEKGLYLPPMTWGIQYKYSSDGLLLVFASHHYDAGDYIRDYKQFLAAAARSA